MSMATVAGAALVAIALIPSGMAAPDDPVTSHYSPALDTCLNTGEAAEGVTNAMVNCTLAEQRLQDHKLNRSYKAALARLTADQRKVLRQSERRWIAGRQKKCDAAYHQEGGTIDRILGASCILHETTARRLWLEHYPP